MFQSWVTHSKLRWGKERLLCRCSSTVTTIVRKHASKTAWFNLKIAHPVAPRHGTCLVLHLFAFLRWHHCYGRTTALTENNYAADQRSS